MKTVIVGAGMAGLAAATTLHQAGKDFLLLDRASTAGGRVRTDHLDGFTFDHGFQVLLTAYPEAKHFFDYKKLQLRFFEPGAVIHKPGEKPITLADPLRQPSALFRSLFEPRISLKDKWKTLRLKMQLSKKSIEEIFNEKDYDSQSFLKDYGFSASFIDDFYKPFFAGISLQDNLQCSSRFFKFVFKMFSQGAAAIPSQGISALADQLLDKLPPSSVQLNTEVTDISNKMITTSTQEQIPFDKCILAVPKSSPLWQQFSAETQPSLETYVFYFAAAEQIKQGKKLHLFPDPSILVNNLVNLTSVAPEYSANGNQLMAVQVNKLPDNNSEFHSVANQIQSEIADYITAAKNWRFLKAYHIPFALPLHANTYLPKIDSSPIADSIWGAGDSYGFASLQAALLSGRQAAESSM